MFEADRASRFHTDRRHAEEHDPSQDPYGNEGEVDNLHTQTTHRYGTTTVLCSYWILQFSMAVKE